MSYLCYIADGKQKDDELKRLIVVNKNRLSGATLPRCNLRIVDNYLKKGSSNNLDKAETGQQNESSEDLKGILRNMLKNTVEKGDIKDLLLSYLCYIADGKQKDKELEQLIVANENRLSGATLPRCNLRIVDNYLQKGSIDKLKGILRSMVKNTVEKGDIKRLLLSYLEYIANGKQKDKELEQLIVANENRLSGATLSAYDLSKVEKYLQNESSDNLDKAGTELQNESSDKLKGILRSMLKNTVKSGDVKDLLYWYLLYIDDYEKEDKQLEDLFVAHKNKLSAAMLPKGLERSMQRVINNYLQNGSSKELKEVLKGIQSQTAVDEI